MYNNINTNNENKLYIIIAILIYIILSNIFYPKNNYENHNVEKVDTLYKIHIKDSIKYNIRLLDSTVYVIKRKMKYEIEEIKNYNDSDAVNLFKQLTSD